MPLKKIVVKPKAEIGQVSSVGEIFVAFFRLCKRRLLPVLAVLVLSLVVSLLLLAALGIGGLFALGVDMQQAQQFITGSTLQEFLANPQSIMAHPLFLGGGALLLLVGFLLWSWSYTAMLAAAIDEHHGILEALCTGWKYLFSMLWVSTLFVGITISWMLIVSLLIPAAIAGLAPVLTPLMPTIDVQHLGLLTGSVLFIAAAGISLLIFLLLASVIPLSMSFCLIIMIDEGQTNIDALLISRLYVRGHWWDTFFKLFLISIILTALTLPLSLLPLVLPFPGHQFAIQFVSFLTTPLMLLFMVAVYRDLKQAAGRVDTDSSCRCLWIPMAIVGILLPLLGVIGAGVAIGPKLPDNLENILKKGEHLGNHPVVVAAPDVKILPSVDGGIIWRDPIGDTSNPLLDIREVSAFAEKGELQLVVTLAKPFAEYFAANGRNAFDPLMSFYFDTDKNAATGIMLPGEEARGGYDLELDVLLASPPDAPVGTGQAYPSLYAVTPQKRQSLAPLDNSTAVIKTNTLTIRLPYARLDAVAGSSLKICFREAAQKDGSGLSNDQVVPVK